MTDIAQPTSQTPPSVYYDPRAQALMIEHLQVNDPTVLGEIRNWTSGRRSSPADDTALAAADLAPFCLQALSAGAAAIRGAGGTQEAHHLDHLITQVGERANKASQDAAMTTSAAADQATKAMAKAAVDAQRTLLDAGRATRQSLTEHVDLSRRTLTEDIQRLVGGDHPLLATQLDGLLGKFATELDDRVGKRTDELFSKAAKQLDPRDPTSPLAEFTKKIGEQQTALTDHLGKGQKDIEERLEKLALLVNAATAATAATNAVSKVSPIKGGTYADGVHEQLQAMAVHHGDEYHDTSSEVGRIDRCRKGDGILIVSTGTGTQTARITIEMTDSKRPRWTDYLDEAERNRDAVASLGLVRTVEHMPGGEPLRAFGPRRMVMAFDPLTDDPALLKVVVQLLRTQATLALSRTGGEHVRTAEEKLTEATVCLQKLTEVQKTAGSIRKGAEKIDLDCAGLHTTIQRLLAEAISALGGTDEAAA
jgi:hypothetical protein